MTWHVSLRPFPARMGIDACEGPLTGRMANKDLCAYAFSIQLIPPKAGLMAERYHQKQSFLDGL